MEEHVFIVTMYRWGNRANHHYILLITRSEISAREAALEEEMQRGGKYESEILEVPMEQLCGVSGHRVVQELKGRSI